MALNARSVFEAVMRSKGHDNFRKKANGAYENPGLQTRWNYFLLGWEMRGAG